MTRAWRLGLGLIALALLHLATRLERPGSRPPTAPSPLRSLVAARDQARAALIGCAAEELDARRRAAAAASLRLARHPAGEPARVGAALLEAAGWLRAAGDDVARELYAELAAGPRGDARDRACLELAHLDRRAGDLDAALVGYEALLDDGHAGRARRDQAAWWCARTHELSGRTPAAARAWRRLVERARDPCLRARAWDRLARVRLETGDIAGARAALAECELTLAAAAAQRSPQGAALRATLAGMLARRRLAQLEHASPGPEFSQRTTR